MAPMTGDKNGKWHCKHHQEISIPRTAPPTPLCEYNVNGSKTSSSQNGYSPDWSLGHLGLSEGKSNKVWMEQRQCLTEMVCWLDVSPADPQPSESSSHADSPYRFIPPFLAPGFAPCSTQYTVVEMNFVSLPLEQSIFSEEIWQPLMDRKVHALSGTWAILSS